MKKNAFFLLAGAVVLATGVALLARTLLAPPKAPPPVAEAARIEAAPPKKAVLVAARDLEPGEFIDGSRIAWQDVDDAPSRSLYFIRGQDGQESLYGATVRQPVAAGQPVRVGVVVRQGEPGFLAAVLKPGMRAVSIPTSRLESNFGLVSSGDRVDVILGLKRDDSFVSPPTATLQATAPRLAAQTILRDVRVLALNNQALTEMPVRQEGQEKEAGRKSTGSGAGTNFETVTLEVTPPEAEKLAVAKEIGTMQLALRSARETAAPEDEFIEGSVTTLSATTDLFAARVSGTTTTSVRAFRGTASETISLSGQ